MSKTQAPEGECGFAPLSEIAACPHCGGAIDAPAPQAPAATVEDNSQDWAGMDGTTAWHLIERHADNWTDIGKMMGEWLAANQAAPSSAEGDSTDLADFLANTLGFVGDVDDAAAEIVAFLASKAQPKGTYPDGLIVAALELASRIADRVPTRIHLAESADEAFRDIGRMVNVQDDGTHGYRLINDALEAAKDCDHALLAIMERAGEGSTVADVLDRLSAAPSPAPAHAGEPVAAVHWPLSGPPRLLWYTTKVMNQAILKGQEGHQPDLLLYAAAQAPAVKAEPVALTITEIHDLVLEAGLYWQNGWDGNPSEVNRYLKLARSVERHCYGITKPPVQGSV